ncbi:MAG: RHS repeat-associated core domain-containing protein [Chloroflexi bacterium]|nr:RHS repeat-associated core domain-containing protein [Chloroflexota bacterium]
MLRAYRSPFDKLRASLGSVSLTTDGAGAVVSEQKFTAWGVVRAANGAMPTDVGYTGQRADASTGLMFYGARYYDAALARFVSADTIVPGAGNPQALNRYSYVLGNPLKYTDPTGHCAIADDRCLEEKQHFEMEYRLTLNGDIQIEDIINLRDAFELVAYHSSTQIVYAALKGVAIIKWADSMVLPICQRPANACQTHMTINLFAKNFAFNRYDFSAFRIFLGTIAHEFAHLWDSRTPGSESHGGIWEAMGRKTGSDWVNCDEDDCEGEHWKWRLGPEGPQIRNSWARENPWEDWARSFELWVVYDQDLLDRTYTGDQWRARQQFIATWIGKHQ